MLSVTASARARKTLAKRIRELASSGQTHSAALLASYGKELSWAELLVRGYYLAIDAVREAMKEMKKHDGFAFLPEEFEDQKAAGQKFKEAYELHKKQEEILSLTFLAAVHSHDGSKIIELADAVMFFKDKRKVGTSYTDRLRAKLLYLKMSFQDSEPSDYLTLREIAGVVGYKPKSSDLADGFSALRRKCNDLGVPYAKSRRRKQK